MLKLDFVEAKKPWRKTIIVRDGKPEISRPAPFYRCTSHRVRVKTIEEAFNEVVKAADAGWALNRGLFHQPLDDEPRAKKTRASTRTDWVMFDIDGYQGVTDVHKFISDVLGLPDVDFIAVYTSSYGFKPGLRCLVMIPLDKPVPPRQLDDFLWGIQLSNPEIAEQVDIDISGARLIPPIDMASNVPAQLFTIAAPSIAPKSADPFAKNPGNRYVLHKGELRTLPASVIARHTQDEVDELKATLLVQKRTERGFTRKIPPTSPKTDRSTGIDWILVEDPEPAAVTDVQEQGDFIRLNLNGGDSDAYWHPKDKPEYIYSFKGMLMYPTRKLVPEYYQKLISEARAKAEDEGKARLTELDTKGVSVLVALDSASEMYHCAIVTPESTWEDVRTFSRMSSVLAWLDTNKLPRPFEDHPPVYDVVFDFNAPFFDPVNRVLNRFSPPQLPPKLPENPTIEDLDEDFHRLLLHVLGDDGEMVETFMDWMAFLFQKRTAPQSAWLLHGCPGTGKDTLMNIMREAMGRRYTRVVMPHQLKENYNGWVEDTSLVFINEIDASVFKGVNLASRMNEYITAEMLPVRRMRMDTYEVPNRMGIVMASNLRDAYQMPTNDRRLHVPPRQERKLLDVLDRRTLMKLVEPSDKLILSIRGWLAAREYDIDRLRRPVLTAAKEELAAAAQPAAVRLSLALREGDWGFVTELLPAAHMLPDAIGFGMAAELKALINDLYQMLKSSGSRKVAISVPELQALYAALIDQRLATMAPAKFRQYLMHNELPEVNKTTPRKRQGKSIRGIVLLLPRETEDRARMCRELADAGYAESSTAIGAVG